MATTQIEIDLSDEVCNYVGGADDLDSVLSNVSDGAELKCVKTSEDDEWFELNKVYPVLESGIKPLSNTTWTKATDRLFTLHSLPKTEASA